MKIRDPIRNLVDRLCESATSRKSTPSRSDRDSLHRLHSTAALVHQSSFRREGGFNLIEVTMAVAIVAVGMLAIIGLTGNSIQSGRDVSDETIASQIAADILNQRRVVPYTSPILIGTNAVPPLTATSLTTNCFFTADGFPTNNLIGARFLFSVLVTNNASLSSADLAVVVVTASWPLIPKSSGAPTLASNSTTRTFFSEIARMQ